MYLIKCRVFKEKENLNNLFTILLWNAAILQYNTGINLIKEKVRSDTMGLEQKEEMLV